MLTIKQLESEGDRRAFPKKIDKYIHDNGEAGPPVEKELQNIVRYGESMKSDEFHDDFGDLGGLSYNPISVISNWGNVQTSFVITAYMNALRNHNGWEADLHTAASLSYYGSKLRMHTCSYARKRIAKDPQLTYNPLVTLREVGNTIGICMRQGWLGEAQTLATLFAIALQKGDVQDCRNVKQSPHQSRSFIIALLLREKDEGASLLEQQFIDDELIVWLYEHWQTNDVELLAHHLKLLCHRHTHQSRSDSMKMSYEFSYLHHYFDISEVLAVLRFRELKQLDIPVVNHRLMNTNLGVLLNSEGPKIDATLQKTITKCENVIDEYV